LNDIGSTGDCHPNSDLSEISRSKLYSTAINKYIQNHTLAAEIRSPKDK